MNEVTAPDIDHTVEIVIDGVPCRCKDVVVSINGDQLEIRGTVVEGVK